MTDALFELDDKPTNIHACTGPSCTWCAWRDGDLAKAAAMTATDKDPEWSARADEWLNSLYVGVLITSDDLTDACGFPVGSNNQIGPKFSSWQRKGRLRHHGYARATRKQSHARVVSVWQVAA